MNILMPLSAEYVDDEEEQKWLNSTVRRPSITSWC